MQELIPITSQGGKQLIDGRQLHRSLGSKKHYRDWIRHRIGKYGLEEGVDYIRFDDAPNGAGKKASNHPVSVGLTLSTAKELALVENNEASKTLRKHLLKIEEQSHQLAPAVLQFMQETQAKIQELEERLDRTLPEAGSPCYTIMGYARLQGRVVHHDLAVKLGKRATQISHAQGWPIQQIPDVKWGCVNVYQKEALQATFSELYPIL